VNRLANIKSAAKRAKVASVKNLRNRMIKSSVKTALKRFDTALASGDIATATAIFSQTVSKVDKAVAKGVYHKNTANRKKAQLAARLAKAQ
jgi:small subunit ribosomal protein S20